MKIEQALEMAEALLLDNEHGIDSLGKYGDEVAVALYKELTVYRKALGQLRLAKSKAVRYHVEKALKETE